MDEERAMSVGDEIVRRPPDRSAAVAAVVDSYSDGGDGGGRCVGGGEPHQPAMELGRRGFVRMTRADQRWHFYISLESV